MRRRFSWVLLVAATGLTACKDDSCTDIGCTNGVLIDLKSPIAVDETVHVRIEIGDDVRECDLALDSHSCEDVDVTPQRNAAGDHWTELDVINPPVGDLKITITRSGADDLVAELPLTFEDASPNGDGCDPKCKYAVIEV